jgi:antitoxin (DNA-binding transcriptional repressor) of toxin-antitoxin stability system
MIWSIPTGDLAMNYIELSSSDLLHRFADHLQAVTQGQHFIISIDGVPYARLTPASSTTTLDGHDALEAMKHFAPGAPVPHEVIRAWIEEGRE